MENQTITLPKYVRKYNYLNNTATRKQAKGRCSGGLLLLYKNTFELIEQINGNKNCIIARLRHRKSQHVLIVATVYIPPGAKNDKLMQVTMCFIGSLQTNKVIFIGGDFNARTAEKQEIPRD